MDSPTTQRPNKEFGRAWVKYHPSIWGDHFIAASPDSMRLDAQKGRGEELKVVVRSMFSTVNDPLLKMNLIDAVQRLGVAYHFEIDIDKALRQIHDDHINGTDDGFDLQTLALQFRLLRQQGYNVSSSVFTKFKDDEGNFSAILSSDTRGLLSLYEAAFLGIHGDDILDEAISFTTVHLKSALPHLSAPLTKLVELALEIPLHRRLERLQTRSYISIYEEDEERNDVLLEFAKLEFHRLQSLHQRDLRDISLWWKEMDLAGKLPFTRDRVVEAYFWTTGVYFEPHYSRARMIMTKMIAFATVMDDTYDIYGTLEELELLTATIERWDRGDMDQLPDCMKVFFIALLDEIDAIEDELTGEGKSYRIYYLKEAIKDLAKAYLAEARWASSGYVPTSEEYMKVALISAVYPMLFIAFLIGMGEIVTKEVLEWAIHMPTIMRTCSIVARLMDDIPSSKLEQKRQHVASAVECCMKEHGISYQESIQKLREEVASGWKDINKECLKPTPVPTAVMNVILNFTRVLEIIYQHRDGYTDSSFETKERIILLFVDPIPL
ncbi:beta-cubebene synthase-like isoform X2 [Magnolia sinica]|uniref:beta-cubebene synthase-like isoform X2 n=1 Tax=Magnolia sinica TaxID=86752 RepID=UPI00265A94B3|nr:beta-cubebene synthase-like isoform X2 [Magnolia sinica]